MLVGERRVEGLGIPSTSRIACSVSPGKPIKKPATVRIPMLRQRAMSRAAGRRGSSAVIGPRLVGRLDADGDARQADALEHAEDFAHQVDPGPDGKLDLFRQAFELFDEAEDAVAVEPEERVAELERAEAPVFDPVADPPTTASGLRWRTPASKTDTGILQRTSRGFAGSGRWGISEIVADAKPPRLERRPVGKRQRVEVFDVPSWTVTPGRASTSSSRQRSCSASPFTTVTSR